ncbi:MAG: hypothetical protein IPK13_24995 [Deltaproteobacteria bacterium]|nr:hypothetical protein [Deltaproteobacteria bacterium]
MHLTDACLFVAAVSAVLAAWASRTASGTSSTISALCGLLGSGAFVVSVEAQATPWSEADTAVLEPVRTALGFTEGLRPLSLGANASEWRDPAACRECHRTHYDEWSVSRHAKSASNALFLAGFHLEPRRRCVHCHAPVAEETQAFLRAARSTGLGLRSNAHRADAARRRTSDSAPSYWETFSRASTAVNARGIFGVSCAVCHVRDGVILTSRPIETPEHPTRVEPSLKESRFCASCHQFRFERLGEHGSVLTESVIQDTWREAEANAEVRCQDCHMANHGHRMPGAHDQEMLERALSVRVEPIDAGHASVELSALNTGHRFPTGDLFRHLTLEVRQRDAWKTVAVLDRRFEIEDRGNYVFKREVSNESLVPGTVRSFTVPTAESFAWRVRYAFTSAKNIARGLLPDDAMIVTIKQGPLPRRLRRGDREAGAEGEGDGDAGGDAAGDRTFSSAKPAAPREQN